jgi:hypothetical protein
MVLQRQEAREVSSPDARCIGGLMKSAFGFGLALAAAMVALLPARAEAESYTFSYCLEDNSGLCDSLASQLKVEVEEAADGWVEFTFTNDIGIQSSITDLYFDASGFLTKMKITGESSGVDFSAGSANPPSVPGGGSATPEFVVSTSLVADSDPPSQPNGINATGEYLTISLKMATGVTFAEVVDALDMGPDTDAGIRIAAHVQGVGPGGESDSLICCTPNGDPVTPTPEPAILALFGIGLFAVGFHVRRKMSKEV